MTTLATIVPSAASADAERFQTAGVVTVTGGHAVNDTYTSFLPPLLPSLIQSFGLSNTQAGLLSVFLQWPSVLQPFIGYLADREPALPGDPGACHHRHRDEPAGRCA